MDKNIKAWICFRNDGHGRLLGEGDFEDKVTLGTTVQANEPKCAWSPKEKKSMACSQKGKMISVAESQ